MHTFIHNKIAICFVVLSESIYKAFREFAKEKMMMSDTSLATRMYIYSF